MAIYFLADIHLAEHRPAITAAFLDTLAAIAGDAEAVYILGDLYDYWLGDDLASPFHQRIAAVLAALPCPVYYQHGNRGTPAPVARTLPPATGRHPRAA